MKKFLSIIIILFIIPFGLAACSTATSGGESGKLKIVSTIFPGYDFARQIGGDKAEITMLLPPGAESHSYEPSAQDIITIQNCDLFIYVGGESDTWVDGILSAMDQPVKTLKMMDCVTVVEEEHIAGMEEEDEHSEDKAHDEEEVEYDEHVWTSPKNAIRITERLTSELSAIDAENAEVYQANSNQYKAELEKLDSDFTSFFAGVENKTLLFGDRFPLRYFVDAYGLEYYAAFPGCSTETEASAKTITFLVNTVNTEKITTVFYIEFSNHKVADSIAETTGAKTALFHTCHNVSQADMNKGATYVSLMRQNLETLKEAMK